MGGAAPHDKEGVRMKMQLEIYKNAEKEISAPQKRRYDVTMTQRPGTAPTGCSGFDKVLHIHLVIHGIGWFHL
jgi:hypothetical protein